MTRIEQIRQREQVTGWSTFGELHADVTALLTLWDTRDAALRTLVEQWRGRAKELTEQADAAKRADDWELEQALRAELARVIDCADALDAILKETTHD